MSSVGYDIVLAMVQNDESIRGVPLIGTSVSVRHVAGPGDHPMKIPRASRHDLYGLGTHVCQQPGVMISLRQPVRFRLIANDRCD